MSRIFYVVFSLMLSVLTGCSADSDILTRQLNKFKYIQLVPPSNIYKVGSFVFVENADFYDPNPESVSIGSLCSDRTSVDLYGIEPKPSPSAAQDLSRLMGATFKFDANALGDFANINLTADVAQSIAITIDDVTILSYSIEDLYDIQLKTKESCKKLIRENMPSQNAFQIREALVASVSVNIKLKAGLTADVRQSAIAELAKAGVKLTAEDAASIQGKALVYGIRWNPVLSLPIKG